MVEMAACAAVQEGPRHAEQWHEDKSYSKIFQKGAQGVGSRCVPFMTNLIVVLTIIFVVRNKNRQPPPQCQAVAMMEHEQFGGVGLVLSMSL